MGKSVIIKKDCEVNGVGLNVDDEIESSEKYIQSLKDDIRALVMSTPREIKRGEDVLTWIEYANFELQTLFDELETELTQLGRMYLVQSEIEYDKDNVVDNS